MQNKLNILRHETSELNPCNTWVIAVNYAVFACKSKRQTYNITKRWTWLNSGQLFKEQICFSSSHFEKNFNKFKEVQK